MKKIIKVTYPLLCVIIPFIVYTLLAGKSIVIPIVIASTMCGALAHLYDNKYIGWGGCYCHANTSNRNVVVPILLFVHSIWMDLSCTPWMVANNIPY